MRPALCQHFDPAFIDPVHDVKLIGPAPVVGGAQATELEVREGSRDIVATLTSRPHWTLKTGVLLARHTSATNLLGVASAVGPLDDWPCEQQAKVLWKSILGVNLACGAMFHINRAVSVGVAVLRDVHVQLHESRVVAAHPRLHAGLAPTLAQPSDEAQRSFPQLQQPLYFFKCPRLPVGGAHERIVGEQQPHGFVS